MARVYKNFSDNIIETVKINGNLIVESIIKGDYIGVIEPFFHIKEINSVYS